MTISAAAIIPAGGAGTRMGLTQPKQFCDLAGIPLLAHTIRAFQRTDNISAIIVVVPRDYLEYTEKLAARHGLDKVRAVVPGGKLRQDSVRNGLAHVPAGLELVAVHDGARPLVSPELINACLLAAREHGAALAAIPVKDTLKAAGPENTVRATVDRRHLWQAQTPQVCRAELLHQAFAAADRKGLTGTDDSSLLEGLGCEIRLVEGSETNLKITRPEDLLIAEALLMKQTRADSCSRAGRIGHGYDVHRLVPGRPLILGGVAIPHPRGLLGHSDADVLTHALCDAVLGASGAGDLGAHFPDTEPRYQGVSSLKLLEQAMALAHDKGYRLGNADVTVVAQHPKLAPHLPAMRANLARACRVSKDAISIKATTTEQLGFAGREEGIAAHAVALIVKNDAP